MRESLCIPTRGSITHSLAAHASWMGAQLVDEKLAIVQGKLSELTQQVGS